MRLLCTIIGCVFLLSANTKKISPKKIIDVHFHARLSTDYGEKPAPNPVTGKIPKWKNDKDVIDVMLAALKNNNVVKAIASGSLTVIRDFQIADSGRFIPALDYVDMQHNPLPDTSTFIRYIREKKFAVFGELGLQYEGKTLEDPEFEPYLAVCERMGIPKALHTGMSFPNTTYTCCPKFRTRLGNPQLIEEVLVKHPKLKLQLMHMGYPYLQETKTILNVYPQVYTDIAAIDWLRPVADFYSYLKSFMEAGLESESCMVPIKWHGKIPSSIY